MKKGHDRVSVIEDALGSFEWLSKVGVWSAFTLAGISFFFWAGLEVSFANFLSFAFLSFTCFPLPHLKLSTYSLRIFATICALLTHALVLKDNYVRIPPVLLIIPSFLLVEILQNWFWKIGFTATLWTLHVYWTHGSLGNHLRFDDLSPSLMGALVTLFLVFMFTSIHSVGKKVAARKFDKLREGVDFRGQRVHASRLQILGELSAALVHELSTPVTNLSGFFSQLIEVNGESKREQNKEIFDRIQANLVRMMDLLHGFRSFSRIQPTENQTFKSSELFRDLELLSRPAFQSQRVELKIVGASEDFEILANRVEIGQVMMNFLLNALASTKGCEQRKVVAGCGRIEDHVTLFVEDTGPGVPEDLKEKIFRPFFSTKGDEGSGLGLYISQMIADHHECTIRVRTAEILGGNGARFELVLPDSRIGSGDIPKAA